VTLTGLGTTGGSVLRLEAVGSGFNVNWVGFTETGTLTATPTPIPTTPLGEQGYGEFGYGGISG
jgi:hypothetical protein